LIKHKATGDWSPFLLLSGKHGYRRNSSRETRENVMTNKGIRQEVFRKALGKCLWPFSSFNYFFGKLSSEKSLLLIKQYFIAFSFKFKKLKELKDLKDGVSFPVSFYWRRYVQRCYVEQKRVPQRRNLCGTPCTLWCNKIIQ
jgi:hypothetical protein